MRLLIFAFILTIASPVQAGWVSDWFGGAERNEHRFLSVTAQIQSQVAPNAFNKQPLLESRKEFVNRTEIIDQCDLRASRQCILNLYQPRELVITLIEEEDKEPQYEIGVRYSGGPRVVEMGTFSYADVLEGIDLERDLDGKSGIWHFSMKGTPVGD